VALDEAGRFTGETPRALMDLVRAGVLEQVPGRRVAQLTATSLRAWMAGRDVDDGASGRQATVMPLRKIGEPAHDAPSAALR
jgi:hypothetical protein